MAHDEPAETVFMARSLTEADLIAGLLGDNGIDASIENEEGVTMLDGIVSGNRGVPVRVRREDLDEARTIIEEARARGHLADDEEE